MIVSQLSFLFALLVASNLHVAFGLEELCSQDVISFMDKSLDDESMRFKFCTRERSRLNVGRYFINMRISPLSTKDSRQAEFAISKARLQDKVMDVAFKRYRTGARPSFVRYLTPRWMRTKGARGDVVECHDRKQSLSCYAARVKIDTKTDIGALLQLNYYGTALGHTRIMQSAKEDDSSSAVPKTPPVLKAESSIPEIVEPLPLRHTFAATRRDSIISGEDDAATRLTSFSRFSSHNSDLTSLLAGGYLNRGYESGDEGTVGKELDICEFELCSAPKKLSLKKKHRCRAHANIFMPTLVMPSGQLSHLKGAVSASLENVAEDEKMRITFRLNSLRSGKEVHWITVHQDGQVDNLRDSIWKVGIQAKTEARYDTMARRRIMDTTVTVDFPQNWNSKDRLILSATAEGDSHEGRSCKAIAKHRVGIQRNDDLYETVVLKGGDFATQSFAPRPVSSRLIRLMVDGRKIWKDIGNPDKLSLNVEFRSMTSDSTYWYNVGESADRNHARMYNGFAWNDGQYARSRIIHDATFKNEGNGKLMSNDIYEVSDLMMLRNFQVKAWSGQVGTISSEGLILKIHGTAPRINTESMRIRQM